MAGWVEECESGISDDLLLSALYSFESSQKESDEYDILSDALFLDCLSDFEAGFLEPDRECPSRALSPPVTRSMSRRFSTPVSNEEIRKFVEERVPKNTKQQTSWSISVWTAWSNARSTATGETVVELSKCSKEGMCIWLSRFVMEVRKSDGSEYTGESIYQMICGLLRYLRENGRNDVDFFKDVAFKPLLSVIDSKMKQLKKNGIGVVKKQAEPISVAEENLLWEKGLLGESSHVLLDTMVWMCGLFFALRGGAELRDLKRNQIKLVQPLGDLAYLEYQENVSKNNPGGLKQRKVETKTVTHYENKADSSKCFVRLYRLYMEKCPENPVGGIFFLKPLVRPKDSQWYCSSAVGHNTLGGTVKRLCQKGGIPGNKSNHSLRASAATRLFHSNIPEQVIMKVTGHRSTDGVRTYKKVAREQLRDVSNVLQGFESDSKWKVESNQSGPKIPVEEVIESKPKNFVNQESVVQKKNDRSPRKIVLHGCSNITFQF